MGISRAIKTAAAAAFASLALLIPAGPAHAGAYSSSFCSANPNSPYEYPLTLKPGQQCWFYPVYTRIYYASFYKDSGPSPTSGYVCGAITQYPPLYSNRAIDDFGHVGNFWHCTDASGLVGRPDVRIVRHQVANWLGDSIYGQATILNFSNATIKFYPGGCNSGLFGVSDCVWYYA